MNIAKTWNSVLGALEIQLPRVEYNTWLRRTELVHLDNTIAVVSTTTPMLREVVDTRYTTIIREQLRDIIGYSVKVRVIVGAYVLDAATLVSPLASATGATKNDSGITSEIPALSDEVLADLNIQTDVDISQEPHRSDPSMPMDMMMQPQIDPMTGQMIQMPQPMLHDVQIKRTVKDGRIKIIPP